MSERNVESREAVAAGLDWPQVRDMFNERLEENEKALKLQREADNQRIVDLERFLQAQINSVRELGEQYHSTQQRALEVASDEREKSAEQLRKQLVERMDALNRALTQQIEHQAEQRRFQLDAQREGMAKAEANNEKRFQQFDQLWQEMREARNSAIPREVVEKDSAEARRRSEAMLELINSQSMRITEIEARGGGEKDHAADLKSTVAVGVAIVAVIATSVIGFLSLLGG
jgi:hypothetical protein